MYIYYVCVCVCVCVCVMMMISEPDGYSSSEPMAWAIPDSVFIATP